MKRFWIFLLVLFWTFVSISFGQGTSPKMVIDQPEYNAGELYTTAGKIEHTFVIKNTGGSDLHILRAAPS